VGDKTGIQWTDATWNPTVGCSRVSAGCDNCYAIRNSARMDYVGSVYHGTTVRLNDEGEFARKGEPSHLDFSGLVTPLPQRLDQPLRWRKPRRVFVNSMSDLFHADVTREFIANVWAVMATAHQHTYQILTKRPARMRQILSDPSFPSLVEAIVTKLQKDDDWLFDYPLPNVWLGVSAEDQAAADKRIGLLLDTPAAVRFVSAEPLLGPIALNGNGRHMLGSASQAQGMNDGLDWVIAGGESGPGARPMDVRWARELRDQCATADVSFFMKQMGKCPTGLLLTDSHGGDPAEWPEDLRVREFPSVSA
jgi:protein gp37